MEYGSKIKSIKWMEDYSEMIDQTILPYEFKKVKVKTSQQMFDAIKTMIVRGAPAIGIAGAHGLVLGAIELQNEGDFSSFKKKLFEKAQFLKSARPTAVNLMWAIDRQLDSIINCASIDETIAVLKKNAMFLENQDIEVNKKIGENGASLVGKGFGILTHCNAGALATVGWGTAVGVIRSAFQKDKSIRVFADETRPRMQGAKLTTWELIEDGIDVTLLTDGMSAYFMKKGKINMVVTGADRIAANGDTANKIGTYMLAIAAKYHNVPFYIAAPLSTIDTSIKDGSEIPIEYREKDEVLKINGKYICHEKTNAINPSFDVTDNSLISGIITEVGVLKPDFRNSIAQAFKNN